MKSNLIFLTEEDIFAFMLRFNGQCPVICNETANYIRQKLTVIKLQFGSTEEIEALSTLADRLTGKKNARV